MKYCRFACVQYKISSYGGFFDGHLKLFKDIYYEMVEFLRKMKDLDLLTPSSMFREKEKRDEDKVDEALELINEQVITDKVPEKKTTLKKIL